MALLALDIRSQLERVMARLVNSVSFVRVDTYDAMDAAQLAATLDRMIPVWNQQAAGYRELADELLQVLQDVSPDAEVEPDVAERHRIENSISSTRELLKFSSEVYPDLNSAGRTVSAIQELNAAGYHFLRSVALLWPDFLDTVSEDTRTHVLSLSISPRAYLQSMWSLFWSAIRHPLSETTIDLSTGRVLYRT
jgi:hypothetical protein